LKWTRWDESYGECAGQTCSHIGVFKLVETLAHLLYLSIFQQQKGPGKETETYSHYKTAYGCVIFEHYP